MNIDKLPEILEILKSLKLVSLVREIENFVSETMVLPVIDEKTNIRVDFIYSFTEYEKQAIEKSKKIKFDKQ